MSAYTWCLGQCYCPLLHTYNSGTCVSVHVMSASVLLLPASHVHSGYLCQHRREVWVNVTAPSFTRATRVLVSPYTWCLGQCYCPLLHACTQGTCVTVHVVSRSVSLLHTCNPCLSVCLSVCVSLTHSLLSVSLSVSEYVSVFLCLSVAVSMFVSVSFCVCLSVSMSVSACLCLSMPVRLCLCLSVCLCLCLCLSVCLLLLLLLLMLYLSIAFCHTISL